MSHRQAVLFEQKIPEELWLFQQNNEMLKFFDNAVGMKP